ncbi:MAG: glycosyltransferase family 39 protein [Anaerolineales bacterium]|nr:glycosyltransferase family 39 protein [Anaerolineales bacterium]
MTTETIPVQSSILKKKLFLGLTISTVLVIFIMAFSFGLHMYNIEAIGDANAYYTAAVKSMLQSWSNFFFVAAEPGGSVTVDKPPLGLWIEAVFAYLLGVSGFSVSLPNILAGVFGIPLLYAMVKKYMGELAGLIAAFVMTITPVFVATNRNNTMDGLLVFFLLLAAWAFIQATESGKLTWLLLGAFIVGLGFNIKMMQAFLPLPAFYALYFFGSKEAWLRKMVNLGTATILLAVVSLSWAMIVDLTPADSRPYIGSSNNNTVMGLIFGHNGVSRLGSTGGPGGGALPSAPMAGTDSGQGIQPQQGTRQGPPQQALEACASSAQGDACSFTQQNGNTINGSCITPPNQSVLACAPQGMTPQQNGQSPLVGGLNGQGDGTQFSQETGEPGVFRFFTQPLSKQMSWLLPFALISVLPALFGSRVKLPIESAVHKSLLLWGGWLMTCVVFFSMVSGIFHSYYAIMLAPPLGAMVGIGFSQLWSWGRDRNWAGVLLVVMSAITLGFQYIAMDQYGENLWWMFPAGTLFVAGIILLFASKRMAYVAILSAMLVIPMYWTVMTVTSNPNINLPTAYLGSDQQVGLGGANRAFPQESGPASNVNEDLLAYLEANTQDVEYLLAVPSSQQGSSLVIATGRPVLYMGGFGGQDEVVTAGDLSAMVANGELRYVMYGGDRGGKQDIANWLSASCSVVQEFSQLSIGGPQMPQGENQPQGLGGGGPDQGTTLYLCR